VVDTLTREERSARMRLIRSRDTKPEMLVRRLVHAMGYRYRLRTRLCGRPDLAFRPRKKVIFVHGCFWHGHDCKLGARPPKSRVDFWARKIAANRRRDAEVSRHYGDEGWRCLVVWECQLKDTEFLGRQLGSFLDA
jgi:DNA mismatch endonuclease (patch repair protein)